MSETDSRTAAAGCEIRRHMDNARDFERTLVIDPDAPALAAVTLLPEPDAGSSCAHAVWIPTL